MMMPAEFERAVVPRGTTTILCDPHEIANVIGATGLRYMLDCAETTAMAASTGNCSRWRA